MPRRAGSLQLDHLRRQGRVPGLRAGHAARSLSSSSRRATPAVAPNRAADRRAGEDGCRSWRRRRWRPPKRSRRLRAAVPRTGLAFSSRPPPMPRTWPQGGRANGGRTWPGPTRTWPAPSWICSSSAAGKQGRGGAETQRGPRPRSTKPARRSRHPAKRIHPCAGSLKTPEIEPRNRGLAQQAVPDDQHRPAHGPGPLADRPQPSADGPRRRQPHLAAALRQAAGGDRLRLRPQGRCRHASRTARLARVELMENDWSMKHLHRLMVTSKPIGSRPPGGARAGDSANGSARIATTGG